MAMYWNPKLDTMIETIQVTVDNKKRGELLKQAIKVLHDDVAGISSTATDIYSMKKNIETRRQRRTGNP